MSKLVICEKPSVGQAIAKVLDATHRGIGYLEGNSYIVSWCIGHLVELAQPEDYNARYASWNTDDLPILPEVWNYRVYEDKKKQLDILKTLMGRTDVESIVCATDAGREGELIFRLVYEYCGCQKPVERLWISSMEDAAILEGFRALKPSTEYDALYSAALCRVRADWMIGINVTRLFSCLYGTPLAVGRVMIPTLAMAVQRESAISAFVPEKYYSVELNFGDFTAKGKRMLVREDAEATAKQSLNAGSATVVSVTQKEKTEAPPLLYDLTTLQREANRILGYTAKQTLDYAQSLYEKRLITYPRTDSRYLTEDMASALPDLISSISKMIGANVGWQPAVKRVINNGKVSDHHALIPTMTAASEDMDNLSDGEKAIWQMVATRLITATGEIHRLAETEIVFCCGDKEYLARGKRVLQEGWKSIHRQERKEPEKPLPVLSEGQIIPIQSAKVKDGQTKPPKHFTEDTILHAMECASADEFPPDTERKGLGTPATRAGIIEKLVQKGYLERKVVGKTVSLIPTQKGAAVIAISPEKLQSASMTAQWEDKLLRMEHGEYTAEAFMAEIADMVTTLCKTYQVIEGVEGLMARVIVGECPHCGASVVRSEAGWFCQNRKCRFGLWKDNHFFKAIGKHLTEPMVAELLRDGKIRCKECVSRRTGKTFSANVLLTTDDSGKAQFDLNLIGRRK